MNILINVSNQRLTRLSSLTQFVEGSNDFVRFMFNLDEQWNGLTVFAQFIQDNHAYNVYLDDENSVTLPSEIEEGEVTLLLYGTGRGTIGTTNSLILTVDENWMISDSQSTSITPTLYEQLVDKVDDVYKSTALVTNTGVEGQILMSTGNRKAQWVNNDLRDGCVEKRNFSQNLIDELAPDATLSVSGKSADARSVGNAIAASVYDDSEVKQRIEQDKARIDQIVADTTTNATGWDIATELDLVTVDNFNTLVFTTYLPQNARVIDAGYRSGVSGEQPYVHDGVKLFYGSDSEGDYVTMQVDNYTLSTTAYMRIIYAYPKSVEFTELEDIRIGYDGTEYETAGSAVRAQAFTGTDDTLSQHNISADAKVTGDEIMSLKQTLLENLMPLQYKEVPNDPRYIRATATGIFHPGDLYSMAPGKTNACHSEYIKLSENTTTVKCYSVGASASAIICFYNKNKEYMSCVAGTGNSVYKTYTASVPTGAAYVMCSGQVAESVSSYVQGFKVELSSSSDILMSTLNEKVIKTKWLLPDGQDLNLLTAPGIYQKTENRSWSNYPEGYGISEYTYIPIVMVLYAGDVSGNTIPTSGLIQVLITNRDNIFYRYKGVSRWLDWNCISSNALSSGGILPDEQDLDDLIKPGMYIKSENRTWSNYPQGYGLDENSYVPAIVVMYTRDFNDITDASTGVEQFIITRQYGIFYRYKRANAWDEWTSIPNNLIGARDILPDGQDLNELISPGIYLKSERRTWSNYPPEMTATNYAPIILVMYARNYRTIVEETNGIVQVIITRQYGVYYRYKASTYWDNWTLIGRGSKSGAAVTKSIGNALSGYINEIEEQVRETWTALRDIPYEKVHGTKLSFPAGDYKGIPYSGMIQEGMDVFYNRNLNTFFSAIRNPASIMYQDNVAWGTYQSANYGAICSSFTGWLASQPMYLGARESIDYGFERYEYNGAKSITIGDCLVTDETLSSHIIMIADIEVDAETYEVEYVVLVDQTTPWCRVRHMSLTDFETMLVQNGGHYEIGRYANTVIRQPQPIRFSTEVIPDMGDQTYYYNDDDIFVYFPEVPSALYYKKENASSWSSVSISSLSHTTVNEVEVYDISHLITDYATYLLTTDTDSFNKCKVTRINTGTVTVNNGTVTLSGYSNNIDPVWTVTMCLYEGEADSTRWPAPAGYKANALRYSKKLVEADQFAITMPTDVYGYYVRVFYETGYGQAFCDSQFYYL